MVTERSLYFSMPTVALRGIVVFPGMKISFDVGREKSINAIRFAMSQDQEIFAVAQKDVRIDNPGFDDLYKTGTIVKINHVVRSPDDGTVRITVEGIRRAKLYSIISDRDYLLCEIKPEKKASIKADELDYVAALVRKSKKLLEEYSDYDPPISREVIFKLLESHDASEVADCIADEVILEYQDRQRILEEFNPVKRLEKVCHILSKENEYLKLEAEIDDKVHFQMGKNNRENFLYEQMKAISEELNGSVSPEAECTAFREKILSLKLLPESEEKLLKECVRLEKIPYQAPEADTIRTYLEICTELPWNFCTFDNLNLERARKILDRDHTGLEKVKERIIEALAVRTLTDKSSAQILCLVGPPGVGKTSIAKSVAETLGRRFARISLGGVCDEGEIRGHRKTYIGSMPGRIISAIQQAKSANPLILLDEIDKLGSSYKGDPSAALLEVLDPEQNKTFCDHYIDIPFDLSKVLFITTANDQYNIPAPLLDRMEIIELSSYTREEKLRIAKNHLVAKQRALHGLSGANFRVYDETLYALIDGYTREAGVRKLEQKIAALCRKAAVQIVSGEKKNVFVRAKDLEDMLGAPDYLPDTFDTAPTVGLVNGLAWTPVGGEMSQVEISVLDGSGRLEMTGCLGEVMKESVSAAMSYIRAHAEELSVSPDFYKEKDIHIHIPEGAVRKDGPSAGITLATALVSALADIPVDQTVAMTGEISLRGRVLPIGGLREKTMGAYKNGIKTIIIPQKNLPDLKEIDPVVKNAITFVPVSELHEVFERALIKKESPAAAAANAIAENQSECASV